MDRSEIDGRVRGVFHSLFNVDPATLVQTSSPDNVPGWDSLQHLNLVTALEEEFGVALDEEQVVQMLSFGLAVEILVEALAA